MDAVNLGWKLAATVRGGAPDGLLDSYTTERHPFAAAVLRNTMAQAVLLAPGPHHAALKEIVSELMDLAEVKHYFAEFMSRVDQRYPTPDSSAPTGATDHGLGEDSSDWVGRHVPDFPVQTATGSTTAYALARSGAALLLHHSNAEQFPEIARSHAGRVDAVAATGTILDDQVALLIRPDGVVAWATRTDSAGDPPGLAQALQTWFGPATDPIGEAPT